MAAPNKTVVTAKAPPRFTVVFRSHGISQGRGPFSRSYPIVRS